MLNSWPKVLLTIAALGFCGMLCAQRHTETLQLDSAKLSITEWQQHPNLADKKAVVLLSGPNDNWNSDSAWFAWIWVICTICLQR